MGRRARARTASIADWAVTLLGVAGVLGFVLAARIDDENALSYDVFAFIWFFTFGCIKLSLPRLLSKWNAAKSGGSLGMTDASVGH
jgi:hypothetical protein